MIFIMYINNIIKVLNVKRITEKYCKLSQKKYLKLDQRNMENQLLTNKIILSV